MFALDTNTVSYFFRGDSHVVDRLQSLSPSQVGVPAIVAYELRYGLMRLPAHAAKVRMRALEQFLASVQRLDFNDGAASVAAGIRARLERAGRMIGPHDVLIAATAIAHGATLVSRNVREFRRIQTLLVENWHPDPDPDVN